MSQEGSILPKDVEGSSPSGAGSAGSDYSVSSSTKLATENVSAGSLMPASPVINPPLEVQESHDVDEAMPAAVGSEGTTGSNSSSGSVKLTADVLNGGSKPASPLVVHASGDSNGRSKPASPAAVLGADENDKGEEKDEFGGGEGCGDDAAGDSGGVAGSNSKSLRSSSDGYAQDDDVKDAPKPMATAGGASSSGGKGKGKGAAADHAVHIWTERERRKKMKNMYSILHSLLPQLPDKADKATIVGEAVDYIKTLEGTIQTLEKLKMERLRAQQLGAGSSSRSVASSAPPPMRHGTPALPSTRETALANMVHNWNAQQAAAAAARGSAAAPLGPFQSWSSPNMTLSVAGNEALIGVCTPKQPCVLTKALYVLDKYRIDVVTMNISSDQKQSFFFIHARIDPASARLAENLIMTAEDRYKLAVSEMLQWIAK